MAASSFDFLLRKKQGLFLLSFLFPRSSTMRLATNTEQETASRHAMKGFFIGMAEWAGVGIFASALAYSFFPWYRRTQTVNKVS